MGGLEITVVLGAVVLLGALVADRLGLAPPLFLLVVGLVLGFVPELRDVELPPDTVLLLFLPVMLFWESLTSSLRAIRRDFRGIVILSTLLVVATAFGVAGVAYALGMPWHAALVLGAALAPPDATAVAALGRTLPHRNFMLLKGESLTNDGTALVVYAIAVGVAEGGHYSTVDIAGLVAQSYLGGLVVGAAVAGLAHLVLRRVGDARTINVALLLIPFAAYLAAESIGGSGVLAVVVSGILVAYTSTKISNAGSRRQTESVWPLGSYVLNGSLFVLIGLEVQNVSRDLDPTEVGRLLGTVVAVWVGLMVVRFGFETLSVMVIRLLDRRPAQRGRRMTWRARAVSSFAGFRGAVSLALALSVPATVDGGAAFPARDDIVFVTAGVITLTLLIQGPLLPALVRWADLPDDLDAEREQATAEQALLRAVVDALPDLATRAKAGEAARRDLRDDYAERLRVVQDRLDPPAAGADGDGPVDDEAGARVARDDERARLGLAVLAIKRATLTRLRRDGTIDDTVALRLQTQLDVEELGITGAQALE